jgi:hypothetical protein
MKTSAYIDHIFLDTVITVANKHEHENKPEHELEHEDEHDCEHEVIHGHGNLQGCGGTQP